MITYPSLVKKRMKSFYRSLNERDRRRYAAIPLVTSQMPVDHWHELIGDPTLADAILDRLIHNAHRVPLKGESLRKKQAKVVKTEPKP